MISLDQLTRYCDEKLNVSEFADYCPNGLQVEGRPQIARIASGVTASQALIEAAQGYGADLILVHHGYFWKGEAAVITGMRRRRLAMLLSSNISLLAYHLPLDAHLQLGNNAQLAQVLGLRVAERVAAGGGKELMWSGSLPAAMPAGELAARIDAALGRSCTHVEGGPEIVKNLAWCTGGAQGWIQQAIDLGVDAYLSGEISEPTAHYARECGIHYYAAGHHVTERYGVQALGEHLARRFGLEHQFFDIDNPA